MTALLKEAEKLLARSGRGAVSYSPYDAAWLLRSRLLEKEEAQEHTLLEKLLGSQKTDGSWGAQLFYIHDRVVNTLAVVVALAERGLAHEARDKGLAFLQKGIPRLGESEVETIGFELVFPAMLESAHALKLDLPYDAQAVREAEAMGRLKKKLLPPGIFMKMTSLAHSLEAFTGYQDASVFPNGSLGCSPAATAAYLMQKKGGNPDSLRYILQFKQNGWNVPSIYPLEIVEYAWILHSFLHAGLLKKLEAQVRPLLDRMSRHMKLYNGASISDDFPTIDSDDTAMVYILLKETGHEVSTSVLEQFEEQKWFRCFALERNPSISANIHVLEAVRRTPDYPRRQEVLAKLLAFLRGTLRADGSWLDKWQISPYYCTGHAVLAIGDLDPELTGKALDYIRRTQHEDGGWGIQGSSEEETAYALQALASRNGSGTYHREIEAGLRFMRGGPRSHPELWVDKGLYCPIDLVEAACLVWRCDP